MTGVQARRRSVCLPSCLFQSCSQGPFQRSKDLGSHHGAPPSSPQASGPGSALQHRAWGADKKAQLNSVSSPALGVITMPSLPSPARPTPPKRALLVVEGGVGTCGAEEVAAVWDRGPESYHVTEPWPLAG